MAGSFNNQCRDNCEREGNFDYEAQSGAGYRFHVDGAANLINVVTYDVHADTAA